MPLKTRRQQIFELLLQEILDLWAELGISPSSSAHASTSNSPSSYTIAPSSTTAFDLSILFTLDPNTKPSTSDVHILTPTVDVLSALEKRKAELEGQRETRMQEIQTLYDALYPLWTKLGVSDAEADEFVEVWKGCEPRCIDAVSHMKICSLRAHHRLA